MKAVRWHGRRDVRVEDVPGLVRPEEGPEAYELFQNKADGTIKAVFKPGA